MSNEYDISKAFQRIEETLIKSMKRNLTRHLNEEKDLGMNWSAWQAEQLKGLAIFKKENRKLFKNDFSTINTDIKDFIKKNYENGKLNQEKIILEAIQNGSFNSSNKKINQLWHIYNNTKNKRIKKKQLTRIYNLTNQTESDFFRINDRKLKALIKETTGNFSKAEMSILRYTNDQYRKIIYDAQVYANTGAGTVQQAVDMATKDFLSKGINSIQYANGAMVNIASYAEMAIRTANKRAYLQGEGEKRNEWGVHTVLVPNRGGGCPYCIKFQGKVFIDDVWSGGTAEESKTTGYPLLSSAVKAKLFHPNCKDTAETYFPGINTEPIPPTKEELKIKEQNYINEQKMNYIDRNINKYSRLELGCLDTENVEKYHKKRLQWQQYKEEFSKNHNIKFNNVTNTDKSSIIKEETIADNIDDFYKYIQNAENKEDYINFNSNDGGYITGQRLNKDLKYDKLPTKVSPEKYEELAQNSKYGKLYRGVSADSAEECQKYIDEFKNGHFYSAGQAGHIYGKGTYTGFTEVGKNTAISFANNQNYGQVFDMLLSEDAKTINYFDLYKEVDKEVNKFIKENYSEYNIESYTQLITNLNKIKDKDEFMTKYIMNVAHDYGYYASIKGYDAIIAENELAKQHYIVILNRGKVIISE